MIYNIIMKVRAYGKLNLSLYITGRRGRLHTLDSVMTSVTVFDEAEILPSDRTRVRFLNASVNPERNTALSAAALVEKGALRFPPDTACCMFLPCHALHEKFHTLSDRLQ